MSMYDPYHSHEDCQEPSEFDEAVDGFKELLRKQVADEVQDELYALRKSNGEMVEQLKELPKLLREASKAKVEYEAAKRSAEYEASKKGVNELLMVMATPKFSIRQSWKKGPKCDKCDDDRHLPYTTPSGRKQSEACECNTSERYYIVQESMAHSIGKTRYGVQVWYVYSNDYLTSPEDKDYIHTRVLYTPDTIEKMVNGSTEDYGFEDRGSAQELADAKNARVAK